MTVRLLCGLTDVQVEDGQVVDPRYAVKDKGRVHDLLSQNFAMSIFKQPKNWHRHYKDRVGIVESTLLDGDWAGYKSPTDVFHWQAHSDVGIPSVMGHIMTEDYTHDEMWLTLNALCPQIQAGQKRGFHIIPSTPADQDISPAMSALKQLGREIETLGWPAVRQQFDVLDYRDVVLKHQQLKHSQNYGFLHPWRWRDAMIVSLRLFRYFGFKVRPGDLRLILYWSEV